MAAKTQKTADSFTIRKAVRYLEDAHDIELGELSLRNKVRTLEVFTTDPNTKRGATDDSDRNEWHISRAALDAFAKLHKSGAVRVGNQDGSKAYKLSVNAAQLVELRQWAAQRGIAEPVRANKQYTPKSKANAAGAEVQSVEEMAGAEGDEAEALFDS